MTAELAYKSHILIGIWENGVKTVIADWPQLPKQSDVQDRINDTRNGYVGFALCTPTSIMPAGGNGTHAGCSSRFRRGKSDDGVSTCHHRLVLEHRRCLTCLTSPPRPPQGKCRLLLPE
jgi:hypothetical protein